MAEKYYISTAIAYTSGKPHIGNTYEIVLADAIARWKRLKGYDVYFQTGTDEHGIKIEEKAAAAGVALAEDDHHEAISDQEIAAAIITALKLYKSNLHDQESEMLTIHRITRAYSPWSSKIHGLTQLPERK